MKNLSIYVIVDKVSETILSVFSAINSDMAKRQYDQALESNKDKIFDPADIVLMVPRISDLMMRNWDYSVPETYEEVVKYFQPYGELTRVYKGYNDKE